MTRSSNKSVTFKSHMEKLAFSVAKRNSVEVDRRRLTDALNEISLTYDGVRYRRDDERKNPHRLAEISPVIGTLIAMLADTETQIRLSRNQRDLDRLDSLVRTLDALRKRAQAVLQEAKKPNVRHDPDLYVAVRGLRDYWEGTLGLRFTSDWQTVGKRREPISPAACFVFDAMSLVDKKRLGELPKVMANVIREERLSPSLRKHRRGGKQSE